MSKNSFNSDTYPRLIRMLSRNLDRRLVFLTFFLVFHVDPNTNKTILMRNRPLIVFILIFQLSHNKVSVCLLVAEKTLVPISFINKIFYNNAMFVFILMRPSCFQIKNEAETSKKVTLKLIQVP